MLQATRHNEHLYEVPKIDLDSGDVKGFINELRGFHEQFYDCFQRSESREHFLNYMAGQFSPLERKSIEPIALAVEDGNVRAMQRFVSDAPWDDNNINAKYRSYVNDDLGSPDGAMIFDETTVRLETFSVPKASAIVDLSISCTTSVCSSLIRRTLRSVCAGSTFVSNTPDNQPIATTRMTSPATTVSTRAVLPSICAS